MASSMMHMAVAKSFADQIENPNLLYLGCVLVDAGGQESHFRARTEDGRKFYDLNRFRAAYGDRLLTDDFALGYYMHLIQDMTYRTFVYQEHGWNPRLTGNVERLYNDYRLLNTHLAEKYDFGSLALPEAIRNHPLLSERAESVLVEMQSQFEPYREGEYFFLTPAMAAEYIGRTAEVCKKELAALREGRYAIDPMEYAYGS